jgi:hypothetical protein
MHKKINKFLYNMVIQYQYNGGAWEDVMEYESHEFQSMLHDLKEYHLSVRWDKGQTYRRINRRVLNPDYIEKI